MANIAPSLLNRNDRATTVTWTSVTETDTATAAGQLGRYPDKTVQVTGTFDSATVTMQGSMDGSNWTNLTTNGVTAASLTAAGMLWLWETPLYIKPLISGGGSNQSLTIVISCPNGD